MDSIKVVGSVDVACIQNLSYNRKQTIKSKCCVLCTGKHNPAVGRRFAGRAVQVRIKGGNDGIPQIWKYDRSKD